MRLFFSLLATLPLWAVSNAITVRNTNLSAQTGRVVTISRPFVKDEICDYPRPYVSGTGASVWQSEHINRWPASAVCASGSVKKATISWQADYTGTSITTVDFRNSTNPCSSGNQAACDAAALDEAGMLAFNGGTWTTSMIVTPNPAGTTTPQTFNARTVLDAARFEYYLRGPAVTQVIVGDRSSTRTDDFGWQDWRHQRINTPGYGLILAGDTSITVVDGSVWASLPRPFTIGIDSEHIQICYVSGNVLTVGTTNGASSACATSAGRGVNGTTATFHSYGTNGNFARIVETMWATTTPGSGTSITLNDATSINSETVLQMGSEQIRVCNRSGNTLTVGIGAWGCVASSNGRNYNGTSAFGQNSNSWQNFIPVYNLTATTDRWTNAPSVTFKSLHPEAILTFKKDQPGVGIYYVLWNDYWTSIQDQEYDIQITVGASTIYTGNEIRHIARTGLRYPVYSQADMSYWHGTAPDFLRINHNHTYLVMTGAVYFDPTITVDSTFTNSLLVNNYNTSGGQEPAWNGGNNDKCVADTKTTMNSSWNYVKGSLLRVIDTPGGRPDIGPQTLWDIAYLYGMALDSTTSDSLEEMSKSIVNCVAQIPWYARETSTSNWCDNGDYPANPSDKSCTGSNLTASAFGRFVSIDLHPQICPINNNTITSGNNADKSFPVGPGTANRFSMNTGTVSHITATLLPALLSDDYFAYEVTVRLGGMHVTASEFFYSGTLTSNVQDRAKYRLDDIGLMNHRDGIRQAAWSFRNFTNSWYIARDGTPEKEYLAAKMNRNIGFWEGMYNQTNGSFYIPCPSPLGTQYNYSPWCFGNSLSTTPLASFPSEPFSGYLAEATHYSVVRNWNGESPWMRNYWLHSMADADRKGFTNVRNFRKYFAAGSIIENLRDPAWSFWFESYYRIPQTPCIPEGTDVSPNCSAQAGMTTSAAQWYYVSKANQKAAFTYPLSGPNVGGIPTGVSGPTAETDMLSGYWQIAKSAMYLNRDSYLGSYTGKRTFELIDQNVRYKNTCSSVAPMWCPIMNPDWTLVVTPGDTSVMFTGNTPYGGGCKINVSPIPLANSDDSGDTVCTFSGAALRHITTGLTASTVYYYRITINNVIRTMGTFTTTASAGGAATVTLNLKAPSGYGTVNDVLVEYGSTSGLGSSTTASCATTCTPSFGGNTGRPYYYKLTWRATGPVNLVSSSIYSGIP